MTDRSYDDLPDAAVHVVLAVPLQPSGAPRRVSRHRHRPVAGTAEVIAGADPAVPRRRARQGTSGARHARRARVRPTSAAKRQGRRRSPTAEAVRVGLAAAVLVFAAVAALLMLVDQIWG